MQLYIPINKGLIDPNHVKKIGSSIWEFMWCVDRSTEIDENGIGWVYGGKEINLDNISKNTGKTNKTTSENINKLEKNKYIIIIHTPYGLKIGVNKLKKRFNEKVIPLDRGLTKTSERFNEKVNRTYREYKENISTVAKATTLSIKRKKMEDEIVYEDEYAKKPSKRIDKAYKELLNWGEDRRSKESGRNFKFSFPIAQYKAMKSMRVASISPDEIKTKWIEMERNSYWSNRGFDFIEVAKELDKKR